MASSSILLTLAILAFAPAEHSQADLTGARWSQTRVRPEVPPAASVVERTLRVEVVEGGVVVQGRWRLHASRPAWFANALLGPTAHLEAVTINGRPATTWSSTTGTLLVERIDGEATVELRAFVPGTLASGLDLDLMGATRGSVRVAGGDAAYRVEDRAGLPVLRRGETFVTGSANLRFAPRPSDDALGANVSTTVVAQVGVGLTVGDAELEGRARLRWVVRRGSLEAVSFDVTGVGPDLLVEGPNVADWSRAGDRIDVTLRQPVDGRLDVSLVWSSPVSKASESRQPIPTIAPHGVFRTESSLQLARDGEVDVVPSASAWSPIAAAQLPVWGEGLVQGVPTAAFKSAGSAGGVAALNLLRFVPVPGPPMVIDVADVRVASSQEGRYAMRARYEIRNERAAHLLFQPPPGATLTGITVAGQPVRAAREGDTYRIPLPRSLETLEGLTLVPVVVGLLGTSQSWRRRAKGELELPAVNAPIAVLRGTHVLPPRYRSRLSSGEGAVVDGFSRGERVAYGLNDDATVSQADQVYADAVEAWNNNEFDDARDKLGQLGEIGARNTSTTGLNSNVELVLGEPQQLPRDPTLGSAPDVSAPDSDEVSKSSSMAARRIRAQVRARSGKKRVRLSTRKKNAKALQDAGRYDEAKREYEKAIGEAMELDRLEDEESKDYAFEAAALEEDLEETQTQSANRETLENAPDQAEHGLLEPGMAFGLLGPPQPQARLPPPLVPIVVPMAGHIVQHEFLLLEADDHRTIKFDARAPIRGHGK